MDRCAGFFCAMINQLRKVRADRIGKGDMRHQPVAEKGADALFGLIEKLIGDNDIQRTDVLF